MEVLHTAVEAVRGAGGYARERLGRGTPVEYKGPVDTVTAVDKANEAFMVDLIAGRHPHHGIVGEEGTDTMSDSRFRWYIDPLDGTVNYAHGLPWFSVSAGLLVDGVAEVGAVYVPVSDELLTAVRGGGAFCNGNPIRVSDQRDLQRALLGTGFPYDVSTRLDDIVTPLRGFLQAAQGIRRAGSAAMDLCMVASGRYDGFWELGLKPWDVAAGFLIIREAGGRVSNFRGEAGALVTDRVVASNGWLHDAMLTVLERASPV